MVAGRVVRFDSTRGYGFIAPENGSEDVFLHVNDLLIPESYVRSGLAVEFEVESGGRGLKASSIRLAAGAAAPPAVPAPRPAAPQPPTPAVMAARPVVGSGAEPAVESAVESAVAVADPVDEEATCDVLSADEHTREMTELLLEIGGLTGEQIVQVRQAVLRMAEGHGWIDG
ncbi:cold shock domain-containing protein [Nonomuraea jabiensis]|uniref:cold-shock protein n=1 Tax=Nonomuraea jabiensis TaxID=882448 RepID=UPI00343A076B